MEIDLSVKEIGPITIKMQEGVTNLDEIIVSIKLSNGVNIDYDFKIRKDNDPYDLR